MDELRTWHVGLRALAGAGDEIDTATADVRVVFGIFAALAEFERELIAERTHSDLAAARVQGRLDGRSHRMDRALLVMALTAMEDRETNAWELARRLRITTATPYMFDQFAEPASWLGGRQLPRCAAGARP